MKTAWTKVAVLAGLLLAPPIHAADLDSDGIPDEFENELLQRFAPVVKTDQPHTTPEEFRPIPVSASWFVQHTDLGYRTNFPVNGFWFSVLENPTPEALLIYSITNRAAAESLYLGFRDENSKWGNSPIDPTGWTNAIARHLGVYGRVWRPWPNSTPTRPAYPNLYSVQYFMLFTWNESGDCDVFNDSRHDGDVICVDYCVDADAAGGAAIIHAIYHIHGKQVFATRDIIGFENGHPLVFLERGSNEAWPNAGADGTDGWPHQDGFAQSDWVCVNDVGQLPEWCCERQHQGAGNVYHTADIPNIGEAPWPDGATTTNRAYLPLGSLDSQLFLQYPGPWGRRGGPPTGPAFQSKMWRREVDGPWAAFGQFGANDPRRPNLESMSLLMSSRLVGTNVVAYDFLPVCDVRAGYVGDEKGLPSKPYSSMTTGVQKVATYGVLRAGAGMYSETMEISKPMQIESTDGMVTIGQ